MTDMPCIRTVAEHLQKPPRARPASHNDSSFRSHHIERGQAAFCFYPEKLKNLGRSSSGPGVLEARVEVMDVDRLYIHQMFIHVAGQAQCLGRLS